MMNFKLKYLLIILISHEFITIIFLYLKSLYFQNRSVRGLLYSSNTYWIRIISHFLTITILEASFLLKFYSLKLPKPIDYEFITF